MSLLTAAAATSKLLFSGGATLLSMTGLATGVGTVLGLAAVAMVATVAGIAVIDRLQKKDVLRHNFPVLGRLTPLMNWAGKFFRNHIILDDRAEQPFNRAQREAVYSFSEHKSNKRAFGSTIDLKKIGSYFFPNSQFFQNPVEKDLIIGPDTKSPYTLRSIFNISAMSYGSISKPAASALSRGAKIAGIMMDTGEGGLAPAHLEGGGDLVFEIGTAKYGVRDDDGNLDIQKLKEIATHDQVKMFSVKLAQGAKPGEGGRLPGVKVTPEIAEIRGIPVGQDSESPDQHSDIRNVSDLLDFIAKVRTITGKPVGFKTIYSRPEDVQDLCNEIKKRGMQSAPDFIILDGGEGGSGAATQTLMDSVGMSIRESLPMVKQVLIDNKLNERVRIGASGKLVLPEDVAWAMAMGADFVNSARGFLLSMGCVMAMRCNKDTCPVGLTTNNPQLQKGFNSADKGVRVANYAQGVIADVEKIAHSVGVASPRELRPEHVNMVVGTGKSVSMKKLYPRLKF